MKHKEFKVRCETTHLSHRLLFLLASSGLEFGYTHMLPVVMPTEIKRTPGQHPLDPQENGETEIMIHFLVETELEKVRSVVEKLEGSALALQTLAGVDAAASPSITQQGIRT